MQAPVLTRTHAVPPILVWVVAGFGLYLVVGAGSLFLTALLVDPVLAAIGLPAEAGAVGLSVRNALHPVVWGVLVALAAMPIGRGLEPGLRFRRPGWLVLATGLALASVTWFLIEEFVRDRFSYVDVQYTGFSLLTWPALVGIAVSGWAALAVPVPQRTLPAALVILGSIGLAAALLPSLAGVADGIAPESIPLAAVFAMDVAYGIGVIVAVLAPRRDPAPA